MGRSLPRMCKACNLKIRANFARHATKTCKQRNGGFRGWTYFNRDGKRVDEEMLPFRKTRVTNGKRGKQVARSPAPRNSDLSKWNKVKRATIMSHLSIDTRKGAFRHYAKLLLRDKRMSAGKLHQLLEEAATAH